MLPSRSTLTSIRISKAQIFDAVDCLCAKHILSYGRNSALHIQRMVSNFRNQTNIKCQAVSNFPQNSSPTNDNPPTHTHQRCVEKLFTVNLIEVFLVNEHALSLANHYFLLTFGPTLMLKNRMVFMAYALLDETPHVCRLKQWLVDETFLLVNHWIHQFHWTQPDLKLFWISMISILDVCVLLLFGSNESSG